MAGGASSSGHSRCVVGEGTRDGKQPIFVEVEKVIGHREVQRGSSATAEYLVVWLGYRAEDASWVPRHYLQTCKQLEWDYQERTSRMVEQRFPRHTEAHPTSPRNTGDDDAQSTSKFKQSPTQANPVSLRDTGDDAAQPKSKFFQYYHTQANPVSLRNTGDDAAQSKSKFFQYYHTHAHRMSLRNTGDDAAQSKSKFFQYHTQANPVSLRDTGDDAAQSMSKFFQYYHTHAHPVSLRNTGDDAAPAKVMSGKGGRRMMYPQIWVPRSDSCVFVKEMYSSLVEMIMNSAPHEDIQESIKRSLLLVLRGQVPVEDLVITKTFGKEYTSASTPLLVYSKKLKHLGIEVQPGDQLQFVFCETKEEFHLQGHKMCPPHLVRPHNLQVDYVYYIEHQISNPVEKIL